MRKMITKQDFLELLKLSPDVFNYLDDTYRLGMDFSESPLFNSYALAFDIAIRSSFPEEIVDIINAYVFEDIRDITDNGVNVSLETPEELWDYVKDSRN